VNLSESLRRQFAYDAWANREVLAAIRKNDADDPRSLQLMSHIVAAEWVWLERLKQVPQSVAVWPESDLSWCDREVAELARQWPDYLGVVPDLTQSISYKNSKGESWDSTIVDVLTHVLMHSAYHRGQVASHMRRRGLTPAYTDFIHGIRQGFVR
jgi:uncharacterized damage-inducible protein DinB